MKTKTISFLSLITFFAIQLSFGQVPDWTRVLQFNTYGLQKGDAVTADANYVYMAGEISGPITFDGASYTSIGNNDMILAKINNNGVAIWTHQINAQADGIILPNVIKVDASQNIYVSGTFEGSMTIGSNTIVSSLTSNAFIAKFDANGNGIWVTGFLFTGDTEDEASKIAFDSNNNCYLLSSSTKLIKFNNAGTKLWEQSYPYRTLQAIAIYGSNLYIGGTLQKSTTFGTIIMNPLSSSFNTGFLLQADLNGVYSNSLVVQGAHSLDGTSIGDIIMDNSGNLIITGGFTKELILGTFTITNPNDSYYSYIAKCNSNFVFSWVQSSTATVNPNRYLWTYRIWSDNSNNFYVYGLTNSSFNYGSITVNPNGGQFLVSFDSNGNATNSAALQNTTYGRIHVGPGGKIVSTGTYDYDGSTMYGNLFLKQNNINMTIDWQKISTGSQSGSAHVDYIKHDTIGNTYIKTRIQGYCNYFGTLINNDTSKTIISKHDLTGNLLWYNQIADYTNIIDYGTRFILDKQNNLFTTGSFKSSLKIGNFTLINQDTYNDGYIAKYASNGQLSWTVQLHSNGGHEIYGITSDNSGNVIVSGEFKDQMTILGNTISAGIDDGVFIIKFDASGNLLWANGFPIGDIVWCAMVSSGENNNIYLTGEMYNYTTQVINFGTVSTPQTNNDAGTVLVKFDANGNPLWAHTYGGHVGASYPDNWPVDIKTDVNGNSYLLGWCQENSVFGTTTLTNPISNKNWTTTYLTKIDSSGVVVWANGLYGTGFYNNYGDLLDIDNAGNVYAGGHFYDSISISGTIYQPVGLYDFYVTKYSNDGIFQWIKTIPSDNLIINALNVFDDNALTLVGSAGKNSTLGGFPIIKKGGSSCIVATLGNLPLFIDENINNYFVNFYPNPTNNSLIVETPHKATIKIINIQGQIIKTFQTTEDKTQVDVSALQGGVYIIKLNTEEGSVVRKFIKE